MKNLHARLIALYAEPDKDNRNFLKEHNLLSYVDRKYDKWKYILENKMINLPYVDAIIETITEESFKCESCSIKNEPGYKTALSNYNNQKFDSELVLKLIKEFEYQLWEESIKSNVIASA